MIMFLQTGKRYMVNILTTCTVTRIARPVGSRLLTHVDSAHQRHLMKSIRVIPGLGELRY